MPGLFCSAAFWLVRIAYCGRLGRGRRKNRAMKRFRNRASSNHDFISISINRTALIEIWCVPKVSGYLWLVYRKSEFDRLPHPAWTVFAVHDHSQALAVVGLLEKGLTAHQHIIICIQRSDVSLRCQATCDWFTGSQSLIGFHVQTDRIVSNSTVM